MGCKFEENSKEGTVERRCKRRMEKRMQERKTVATGTGGELIFS